MVDTALAVGSVAAVLPWLDLLSDTRTNYFRPDRSDPHAIFRQKQHRTRTQAAALTWCKGKSERFEDLPPVAEPPAHLYDEPTHIQIFGQSYAQALKDEAEENVNACLYRFNLARLSETYDSAEKWYNTTTAASFTGAAGSVPVVAPGVNPRRRQQTVKEALFVYLRARHRGITDARTNPKTKKEFRKFTTKLSSGRKWETIASRLGPGAFLLMPTSLIPQSFIEQKLSNGQLDAWLDLIKYMKPWVPDMAKAALVNVGPMVIFDSEHPYDHLRIERYDRREIEDGHLYQTDSWGRLFDKEGDDRVVTECDSGLETTEDVPSYRHEEVEVDRALRPLQMLPTGDPQLTLIPRTRMVDPNPEAEAVRTEDRCFGWM